MKCDLFSKWGIYGGIYEALQKIKKISQLYLIDTYFFRGTFLISVFLDNLSRFSRKYTCLNYEQKSSSF